MRVVEGEQPRLDLRNREAAKPGRRISRRKNLASRSLPFFVGILGACSMPSASLSAVSSESASRVAESGSHHEAVDHHVDVVLELLVERRRVVDLVELAVDLDALEALLAAAPAVPCGIRPCGRARSARAA